MAKPSYKYIAETARFAIANIRAICTVDGSTRTDSAAGKAEESARRLTYIAQALEGYDCAQHIADYAESYSYAYTKILQAQEAAGIKRKVDLYLEAASMTYNEMVRCNDIELGVFSPADLLRAAAIMHDNEIKE